MCLTPINVKGKPGSERETAYVPVPCGKCPKCRQRRINGWVFRLRQEEKRHRSSLFITLTYDPANIRLSEAGYMSLDKTDLQKFFKRLRKYTGCNTIRYYACGEYGGTSFRPHYHAIIFDCTPEQIEKSWGLGYVHYGQLTDQSIAYTCKYICKESRIPLHAKDDRVPEFSLMSKRMGSNYLTPEMLRWHAENEANYVVLPGGHMQALPRYYRDAIFNDADRLRINRDLTKKFSAQFDEAVKQAGSLENYYRDRHYAIAAAFKSGNNQKNRNKV